MSRQNISYNGYLQKTQKDDMANNMHQSFESYQLLSLRIMLQNIKFKSRIGILIHNYVELGQSYKVIVRFLGIVGPIISTSHIILSDYMEVSRSLSLTHTYTRARTCLNKCLLSLLLRSHFCTNSISSSQTLLFSFHFFHRIFSF